VTPAVSIMTLTPSCPNSPGKRSNVGTLSTLALPTLNARSPSGVLWGQKPGLSGTPACPLCTPKDFSTSTGSTAERSRIRWETWNPPELHVSGSGLGDSLLPSECVYGSGRRSWAWDQLTPPPPANRCSGYISLLISAIYFFPLVFGEKKS
jgi:hypothetical protein